MRDARGSRQSGWRTDWTARTTSWSRGPLPAPVTGMKCGVGQRPGRPGGSRPTGKSHPGTSWRSAAPGCGRDHRTLSKGLPPPTLGGLSGPPPPASPGTPPTARGRDCKAPRNAQSGRGRRAPELRARPRVAPESDHHRRLLRPAVATVRPAVQATTVQQVSQCPLDLATALRGPLPHVGRTVLKLDLVIAIPVGLEDARHGELHCSSGIESVQVLEAPPHPTRLLASRREPSPAKLTGPPAARTF